jgi:hypothetical protein
MYSTLGGGDGSMNNQPHAHAKRYPVSLQCAADAVFGPNERLKRLLQQPKPEAKTKKENVPLRA